MTSLIFSFDDGTEAIAHYGVKGMLWGVRHDRKPSGNGQRSRALADLHISKGTHIKRVGSLEEKGKLDSNLMRTSPLYTYTNDRDQARYFEYSSWLPGLNDSKSKRRAAVLDFETTKDLKVADEKVLGKLIYDKYKSINIKNAPEINGVPIQNLIHRGSEAMKRSKTVKDVLDAGLSSLHKPNDQVIAKELLRAYGRSELSKKDSLITKELKKRGYDAAIDVEDLYDRELNVRSPLIVLDPYNSLKYNSSKTAVYKTRQLVKMGKKYTKQFGRQKV